MTSSFVGRSTGRTMGEITGAQIDPRIADAALHAYLASQESSMIGPLADAVAAAVNAVMKDPDAMQSLRRAVIAGPPHGTTFDLEQRCDHARGGLIAAFSRGQEHEAPDA